MVSSPYRDAPSDRRPMRVLHLIGQLARGGCELQLAGMVPLLDRGRFESTVGVFWSSTDQLIYEQLTSGDADRPAIRVELLGKRRGLDPAFVERLVSLIRQCQPDVIHAWLMSAGLWGRIAARLAGNPPVIVSYRSEGVHNWPGGVYLDRLLARGTPLAITNSAEVQRIWAERLQWDRSRIAVIHNGVDLQRFAPLREKREVRLKLGWPTDSFVVTMVGTMKPTKNWPMFIELAQACPSALFVAVGGGPLLQSIEELAQTRNLKNVIFMGNCSDVAPILAASDVAVSTSNMEGMSNAVLEAMACGLPVVATAVAGSVDLVREGKTGHLVPAGDVSLAARRINDLQHNREQALNMGSAARQICAAEYSMDIMARRHEEMYLAAVRSQRERPGSLV